MDLELKDKVAIVGGASKGLGRACAQVLAEEGVRVAVCSRSRDDLEKAAQEIRGATGRDVLTFAGDLDRHDTIKELIARTVERFGRLDILVNNSGGPPLARAHNATEEQWATAVQRSLLFFARMSRDAVPHLKKQGGGRIINQHSGEHRLSAHPESGALGRDADGRGGIRQEPGRRGRARRHSRE